MKTLTIGWLNKCGCGNKSHTVKTARGNESALWDDDAVKCNSCGRGGVIQVCEGQARVLWETNEEMAEGKPMSKLTKEWLQQTIAELEEERDATPGAVNEDAAKALAAMKIALASLEAEAVACPKCNGTGMADSGGVQPWGEPIGIECDCTAPPAPVSVPEPIKRNDADGWWMYKGRRVGGGCAEWYNRALDDCRAAMLQGAEPVTTAYKLPDGWVACSERMPEGMTDVHISNGHDVGQGWWDGDTWQTQHDYYSVPGDVTHWMPLPAAPQQEVKP
ncbi:DUF551 domain-containing protein [Enterobacter hormaechei]